VTVEANVVIVTMDPSTAGLAGQLRQLGIAAASAGSVQELSRIGDNAGDFVAIIDSDLPTSVRSQVYTLLQARPSTPVVILAGDGWFEEVSARPDDWRFDGYVTKPAPLKELALRIEAALPRSGSQKREPEPESSGFVCARCHRPVSKSRTAALYAHRGEWFACETPWCDWVQIRSLRGHVEFSSEEQARTHQIPLRGEPRRA